MYFPFLQKVRTLRLRHLTSDSAFLASTFSAAVTLGGASLLWSDAPPGAFMIALTSSPVIGYAIARVILGHAPGHVVQLDVPPIREIARSIEAPNELAREDFLHAGVLLAAADFFYDFADIEELAIIGAILTGLAWVFGKSLNRIKSDAIAELEPKIRGSIDFKGEIAALLDLYWQQFSHDAKEAYAANRGRALKYASRYGRLLDREGLRGQ